VLATVFAAILGVFLLDRFQRGAWKHIRLEHGGELMGLDDPAVSRAATDSATVAAS
jgi:hypothetical protein